jgi:protoheme IX farnesyltransferase
LMLTFGGYTGNGYLAVAAILGLSWLLLAWSGFKASDNQLWARRLFVFSLLCIVTLSVMMSIDSRVDAADRPLPARYMPACSFRTMR